MLRAKYVTMPLYLPKLLRALAMDRKDPSMCMVGN